MKISIMLASKQATTQQVAYMLDFPEPITKYYDKVGLRMNI